MAIARCPDHYPKKARKNYVEAVEPIGYPESAIVCCAKKCTASGMIWLDVDEFERYRFGERIFESFFGLKMRAKP